MNNKNFEYSSTFHVLIPPYPLLLQAKEGGVNLYSSSLQGRAFKNCPVGNFSDGASSQGWMKTKGKRLKDCFSCLRRGRNDSALNIKRET